MEDLEKRLGNLAREKTEIKPQLFDFSKAADRGIVENLLKENKIQHVRDDWEEQQLELFGVLNPSKVYAPGFKDEFREYFNNLAKELPHSQRGRWAFFPWNSTISHILPEEDFFHVRTARNKNLINAEEQDKFYNATVGIGGLSVGSNIAFALVLQGGPKRMRLADMDQLALSNTNRILAGADKLGLYKVEMAARTIYEINPYAEVELFPEGLTEQNIDRFCDGLDVMIDELDTFTIKYLIREQCAKRGIPIVMAADNGDNGVLDVERHDLGDTPFFHKRIGENLSYEMFTKLDKFAIGKTITQLVGPENVTPRMQASLLEMGKTIVSWPQLGGAALLNGAAVAYCVRKILSGEPLIDNRALLNMDALLDPEYHSPEEIEQRRQVTEGFRKMYGL